MQLDYMTRLTCNIWSTCWSSDAQIPPHGVMRSVGTIMRRSTELSRDHEGPVAHEVPSVHSNSPTMCCVHTESTARCH